MSLSGGLLSDPAAHIVAIDARLDAAYGPRLLAPTGDPLGELIATVLSQHTSDVNSARAYQRLRDEFAAWSLVRAAPTESVADAIHCGGLANLKAERIQRLLAALPLHNGEPTLAPLINQPLALAMRSLRALPGVGPKTAACVLLFSCGLPAFPVDTHVYRVSRRLGFVPATASHEAIEAVVETLVPGNAQRLYSLHLGLIWHGRRVCQATRPRCAHCALVDICRSAPPA